MKSNSQTRTRYAGPIAEAEVHPHSLVEQGFATDEALAAMLDRYPAELFDINLYDYDDEGQASLRTGVRGKLDGLHSVAINLSYRIPLELLIQDGQIIPVNVGVISVEPRS